jgi:hypothetical protein
MSDSSPDHLLVSDTAASSGHSFSGMVFFQSFGSAGGVKRILR